MGAEHLPTALGGVQPQTRRNPHIVLMPIDRLIHNAAGVTFMGIRSRSLVAVAVATLVLGATALPSGAHMRAAVGTRTVAASVKAQAVSTAKAKARSTRTPVKIVTKKTTRKKTVTTKKPTRRTVSANVTVAPSIAAPAVVTTPPVTTTTSLANPLPVDTAAPIVVTVDTVIPTTTTIKAPATTLPPAPFPAPANPPLRATASAGEPYRGLGTWVDRFDWTTQWSKKPIPPVNATTVDQMFNAGVQTIYIQAAHWSTTPDVLEREKLQPILDRAHQLGMYVVVWYLPAFQDVNTDLRKVVALANLDVDGISIDIEERDIVKDTPERTRRLIQFTQALRGLLPNRFISNNIIEPTSLDGVAGIWTLPDGKPPAAYPLWWRGPFPYVEIAPAFDLWMIQAYWTNRATTSGWRDGYRYVAENVRRLRTVLNRPDLPVHVIGGVGDKARAVNDISGMLQAAREGGSTGLSFYDWLVTDPSFWQYFRAFRGPVPVGFADPGLAVAVPPPYVPSQPPPVTTTTAAPVTPPTEPGTIVSVVTPAAVPPPA